jgi:hypothetical protein
LQKFSHLIAVCLAFGVVTISDAPLAGQIQAASSQTVAKESNMPAIAEGTNRAFHFTVETTATPERIWALWSDVTTWRQWDLGLGDANIQGPFQMGAKGQIIPKSGPPAAFTVTAFDPDKSYTFETGLPAARLVVTRSFVSVTPTRTVFRHDVSFKGLLGGFWANRFGPAFRQALPPTMPGLARLAEQAPSQ